MSDRHPDGHAARDEEGPAAPPPPWRRLAPLVVPALLIGVGASLVLLAISEAARFVEEAVWRALPDALGVAGYGPLWTIAMLTFAGLAVGLIVWKVPGGAGPDPATVGLVSRPLPLYVLPSLLLAVGITLAFGVSLGPENPIIAANIALAYAAGRRFMPAVPGATWVGLGTAATVGALFSTPVAAALLLSEAALGKDEGPLWDRLFAPLVAAGAGALTTTLLAGPDLSIEVPAYPGPHLVDLLSGALIALAAGVLGLAAVLVFPVLHGWFHRLRHPVLMTTAGGFVLGLLAVLGGPLTMFKGLDEMKELAAGRADLGVGALLLIVVVRVVALLVAGTCGFRGGRIFPALFAGVGLGLAAHALVPAVPVSLAIVSAVLGVLVAVTRQGWLSLFMALTTVPDLGLLPVLCVVVLPVWLLVSGRPEMLVTQRSEPTPASG